MRKRNESFSFTAPMRIPNPQDPYTSRDDFRRKSFNFGSISGREVKPKTAIRRKLKDDVITVSCERFSSNIQPHEIKHSAPGVVNKVKYSRTFDCRQFQQPEKLVIEDEDFKLRSEVAAIVDKFFMNVNTSLFSSAVEKFLSDNINSNNVMFWEEIPSLQRLYNAKYKVIVNHEESIAGSGFHERSIKSYPLCNQHPNWSQKIDGKMLNDNGPAIIFQLRDFSGAIRGVCVIQKKYAEPEMSERDRLLIMMLQQRYTLTSRFFNEVAYHKQLIEMSKLMTIEQFLAVFSMKMVEIFKCHDSEIWDFSDRQNPIFYRNAKKMEVEYTETGIVGYIYSKGQLYNSLSSKKESSYNMLIDGAGDRPFMGIPIREIVILIRGCFTKEVFTQVDENILSNIAPYIVSFYYNSLSYSQKPSAQPGLDLLQGVSSFLPVYNKKRALNGMLEEAMIEIQKMTSSDRVTFFKISNDVLESVFLTGCGDSIKLKVGEGIAGHVAQTGVEENFSNASDSEFFQKNVDLVTGYQTKTMLTVPIISTEGAVKGIIQLINKVDGMPFTKRDSLIANVYGSLCIFMILNSSLLEQNNDLKNRVEMISKSNIYMDNNSTSFNALCKIARTITSSKAVTIFLLDSAKGIVEIAGYDGIYQSKYNGKGAVKYCLDNNKPLIINDTFHDPIVDKESDKGKRNILLVPIVTAGVQIGALEAVNKGGIFDQIDMYTLTCISNILSTSIAARSMMDVIKNGRSHLVIAHYIAKEEMGKSMIPAYFANKVQIGSLKFATYEMDKPLLISAVFEIFKRLDILEHIDCNILFAFLNTASNSYPQSSYHSWQKAISITQLMCLIIESMTDVFTKDEKLALIVASLLSYVGHDGTDDSYHKRLETIEYITAGSTPVHDHMTTTEATRILNKKEKSILPEKTAPVIKKQIICLLASKSNVNACVEELSELLRQRQFDINCIKHRKVFLECLFNMVIYDEFSRSVEICDKWEYIHSLERFNLGKLEADADLTYSSRHNCKELYNKYQSLNEKIKENKQLFMTTCDAMKNDSPMLAAVESAFLINENHILSLQK